MKEKPVYPGGDQITRGERVPEEKPEYLREIRINTRRRTSCGRVQNQETQPHPRAVVVLICLLNSFKPYLSQVRPIILCLRYAIHVNPTQCLVVPASSAAVVPRPPGTVNNLLSRKFQQSTCLRKNNVISR